MFNNRAGQMTKRQRRGQPVRQLILWRKEEGSRGEASAPEESKGGIEEERTLAVVGLENCAFRE